MLMILSWIQNMDALILLYIQNHIRADFMDGFWKAVTFLGNGGWFWIVLAILLLFTVKTRRAGFCALLAMAAGFLITNVLLKNLVGRIRPYDVINGLVPLIARQSDASFPSGHACASFASAFVYLRTLPGRWGAAALTLAILISFSRLYVGVHYPSDVIAGIVIGIVSGWMVLTLYKRKRPKIDSQTE